MSNIQEWALRWDIPAEALEELSESMGVYDETLRDEGESEAGVSARVRLEASKKGLRLWRNNVGAVSDADGNFYRYGLANESSKMNSVIKSSDLIGIKPIKITPQHVGTTIGQFVAREVKRGGWVYKGNAHERAQFKFLEIVTALGGDASFCNDEGSI